MATPLARAVLASLLTIALVSAGAVVLATASGDEGSRVTTGSGAARPSLADLPLSFIENRGQADDRVDYYVHGADTSLYFTSRGLTVSLGGEDGHRWVLDQRLVGADPVRPRAEGRLPGVVSYFQGSPEDWRTAIPTYSRMAYRDVWPGIDLVYSGTGSRLKYHLMVRPGADPSAIRMAYRGASGLGVNTQGQLQVSTGESGFLEDTPYAYQNVEG